MKRCGFWSQLFRIISLILYLLILKWGNSFIQQKSIMMDYILNYFSILRPMILYSSYTHMYFLIFHISSIKINYCIHSSTQEHIYHFLFNILLQCPNQLFRNRELASFYLGQWKDKSISKGQNHQYSHFLYLNK